MNEQDRATILELAKKLYDRKALDIVALDITRLTPIADYMLIVSGRNVNQVKAIADDADDAMAQMGFAPRRKDGQSEGRWIVIDYGNILLEIFHQEERAFYNLERLWEDGENRIDLPFDQTED